MEKVELILKSERQIARENENKTNVDNNQTTTTTTFTQLLVHVHPSNEDAIEFYKAKGFQFEKEIKSNFFFLRIVFLY